MVVRFQTQINGYIMVTLTERTWKRGQIFFWWNQWGRNGFKF